MSIKPREKMPRKLGYFEDSGTDRKKFALLLAAYHNRTETALKLIETDPDQINRQDPHSGLTALHIAIFRQNRVLVERLAGHPKTDVHLKDAFDRKAVDMLDYTADQVIFETMMDVTYPDEMLELEDEGPDDEPPAGSVVPLRPKGP